ncbi:hypothetical protein D3C75_1196820 [compost metagenome]
MAEKLALHQLGRNRTAIDRDKGLAGPWSSLMNKAGDPFLAAAGLATDVHRCLATGQLVDLFAQIAHGR